MGAHKSLGELRVEALRIAEERNRTMVEFVGTDLDLSIAFLEMALDPSNSPEKRKRNCTNARKGYDFISRFLPNLQMSSRLRMKWEERLRHLKSSLEALGERFS